VKLILGVETRTKSTFPIHYSQHRMTFTGI